MINPKEVIRAILYLCFILICLLVNTLVHAQNPIRVGVVIDGPWERNDEIKSLQQQEILTLTEGEFDVRFPEDKVIVADWTANGVRQALQRMLNDPEVDFVLAMGALASSEICRMGDLPKPAIAPFVIDAGIQGLTSVDGGSGIRNLNYLSFPERVTSDIRVFSEIVSFRKVHILVNTELWERIPQLTAVAQSVFPERGIETVIVRVERTIDPILSQLDDAEAVLLSPLLQLQPGEFDRLIGEVNDRKIPSFSVMGRSEVERGVLATASPDIFPKITRRVSLNFQRILLGDDPSKLHTTFAIGERIVINRATARLIGVSPPFAILTEAEIINEQREQVTRTLSLVDAMEEGVNVNLDLLAKDSEVLAGRQNVRLARSNLLPQIEASATHLRIDADRATASFGSQAEKTLSGKLQLSQLIFSEQAWTNVAIQSKLQDIREFEREQLRLEIAQTIATAYLNLLRAKTFERVQKENLRRTREHLELAQVRQAIGFSRRSEVYRWENQIAADRRSVIEANSQRNLAEIQLNRVLHRPLEESFDTEEIELTDQKLLIGNEDIARYFDDPISFKSFRTFMVKEGLASSPEIEILTAALAAKERELSSANRSFYLPTIALQAEASKRFDESGAGLSSPFSGLMLPPESSFQFPEIPEADDRDWSVAFNMSLPLFEGSSRFARRQKAKRELEQLKTENDSVAEKIEQRIRAAMHLSGASYAGIALSRASADAARQNLELVTDAYSRGAVGVLDLVDAQNAALNADLAAANSVYDFFIDLTEAERSIGTYFCLMSDEEREAWKDRLQRHFADTTSP
jgi:outer membrane protein TolC/ABC-type uncharacterized transport system substrate-binding protein